MTPPAHQISKAAFVLATDLDGTFIGGTDEDRDALYTWITENRGRVGLIFVTGRDPDFIMDLCSSGWVPRPDFVIGDVGTTIARVTHKGIEPIADLEAEIAARWDNAGPRVKEALAGLRGLTLQPTEFRYRVSYDLDPDILDPRAETLVRQMGFDVLTSAGQYFDVLPRGISKGPSLARLVSHLGTPPDRVLTAGDTLNDLSMLESGFKAVVVGGAEQALIDALADAPPARVHRAKGLGAAGITEAIEVFDLSQGV